MLCDRSNLGSVCTELKSIIALWQNCLGKCSGSTRPGFKLCCLWHYNLTSNKQYSWGSWVPSKKGVCTDTLQFARHLLAQSNLFCQGSLVKPYSLVNLWGQTVQVLNTFQGVIWAEMGVSLCPGTEKLFGKLKFFFFVWQLFWGKK